MRAGVAFLLLVVPAFVQAAEPGSPDALAEPQWTAADPEPGWFEQIWNDLHHSPTCFYGGKELLLWWLRGSTLPPLATIGAATGPGVPGSLGQPGTSVVLGNQTAGGGFNDGARITLGYWLDPAHTFALESGFFFLGQRTNSAQVSSADLGNGQVLARPYVDQVTGRPDAQVVGSPGVAGTVGDSFLRRLMGADVNLRVTAGQWAALRLDLLAGFRFLAFDDDLNVTSTSNNLTNAPATVPAAVFDSFGSRNRFYGGQIGARADYLWGRWSIQGVGKVAVGGAAEVVEINGFSGFTNPASTTSAGLLAQPTNIGRHTRGALAVVPEIGVNLTFQVTGWLRLLAGYTFLYDSNVVRAANQVDLVSHAPAMSGAPAPGQTHPAFSFQGTDFWAQGISLGFEIRH